MTTTETPATGGDRSSAPAADTVVSDVTTATQGEAAAPSPSSAPVDDDPLGEAQFQRDLEAGKYGEYIKEGEQGDDGNDVETAGTEEPTPGEGDGDETSGDVDAEFEEKYNERYNADPLVQEASETREFLESIGSNFEAAKEAAIIGAALNAGDYNTFSERMIPILGEFALNAPTESVEATLKEAALLFAMRTGNYQAVPELAAQVEAGLTPEAATKQAKRMADQKATEAKLAKLEAEQEQLKTKAAQEQQVQAVGNAYNGFLQQQQQSDPEMYTEVENRFMEAAGADTTPVHMFENAEAMTKHWQMIWKSIEADVLREKVSGGTVKQIEPLKTRTRTTVPDLPGGPVGSHPMDGVTDPKYGF